MKNKLKTNFNPGEVLKTDFGEIRILDSIGKGKSGYSYLALANSNEVVLKVMHDEPVPYYSFSKSKVLLESNDYALLKALDIPVPDLYYYSVEDNFIIKEYIPGITGSEWITCFNDESIIRQLFEMSKILEKSNYNIDYFPSNFVICANKLYYIDYEINNYDPKWDLYNWGLYYWANSDGFKEFKLTGNAEAINFDIGNGIPIKEPFEDTVKLWITKYRK